MTKLKLSLMASFAAALLATSSIAQAESVIRVAMPGEAKVIDPIWTTAHITRNHGYMIYDVLFAPDSKGEPKPQMVDTYSVSPDGKTYSFTLRDGLEWHDGSAVTAADCVASIKRWGEKDNLGKLLFSKLDAIAAKDAKTFEIKLKEPFGLVVNALSEVGGNVAFMMPERIAKTPSAEQINDPTGSGPFIMKKDEWVPGDKMVYVKNPKYKPRAEPADGLAGGKVVKVDRVEWRYIPDDGTRMAALLAGEIDFFLEPLPDMVPILEKSADVVVDVLDISGSQGIFRINHLHPPFNNVKAREAMMWMINQQQYMKLMIGREKFYQTCYALFMCGNTLSSDVGSEALKGYNPEKAKQLLKEAGYDGRPIVLLQLTDVPMHQKAATVTAENLRSIGLNIKIKPVTQATFFQERSIRKPPEEGGWNIFHTDFQGVTIANPLTNRPLGASCDENEWPGWPCNKKIEDLKGQFSKEPDANKRKQIALEIQKEAMQFVTHGWVGQYFKPTAWRKSLQGLIKAPVPVFWNVAKS
jgi:peptide/nickel transport system substrate-binding protein